MVAVLQVAKSEMHQLTVYMRGGRSSDAAASTGKTLPDSSDLAFRSGIGMTGKAILAEAAGS